MQEEAQRQPESEGLYATVPTAAYHGILITLRAISRDDYPLLLQWRTDVRQLCTWSDFRPIPVLEAAAEELGGLLQHTVTLMVLEKQTNAPIGFVQAYNANQKDGWCFVRVYTTLVGERAGAVPEACLAFFDYLFKRFPLRKIYLDLYEYDRQALGTTIEAALVEEGRLQAHTWFRDRYWDMSRMALYRDRWNETRRQIAFLLDVQEEINESIVRPAQP